MRIRLWCPLERKRRFLLASFSSAAAAVWIEFQGREWWHTREMRLFKRFRAAFSIRLAEKEWPRFTNSLNCDGRIFRRGSRFGFLKMTWAESKSMQQHSTNDVGARKVLPTEFYASFLSNAAKRRKPSPIRSLIPMEAAPHMISMLAGKPDPNTYPFASMVVSVKSPDSSSLTDIELRGEDLATALQYNESGGVPELVEWVTGLLKDVHELGEEEEDGLRVCIGAGSQDLLYKALTVLVDPGDTVVVEAPTYPGVLPVLHSLKCNIVGVTSDEDGLVPSSLEVLLDSWSTDQPFPKLLYTVPYGANPTGMSTTAARRIEILHLARKHNILILEDDPYFHLYYGSGPPPPSYLSLERKVDGEIGRVVRFDSLSKILAAGFRLGWTAVATLQPPTFSQMVVLKLLQSWGTSGFLTHAAGVAEYYRRKRDVFETYLNKHLTGLAQWNTPNAAMFYWIKLNLPPGGSETVSGDSAMFIKHSAMHKGVLMLPGESTYHDGRKTCYARVSFSLLSDEDADEVLRRLAAALRDEWHSTENA
ncbi:pyridoxal phosphate-dependent transferase [Desarmillaria tabescens]|uniref:Pyridoxal phosphate-dependent transferase n=1 Tax=Armillaria tabescens TaxID=1929756 RepID=A0AA39JWX3_ARMTA|nr:pyridoxal phosphate-dependent transferase [Desarmillaria tabescens]KAK0450426.1 pyridoxal phosphate-dependent transferase [Desarmillaria tabescens]